MTNLNVECKFKRENLQDLGLGEEVFFVVVVFDTTKAQSIQEKEISKLDVIEILNIFAL